MKIRIIPNGKDFIDFDNVNSYVFDDVWLVMHRKNNTTSYYRADYIEFFNVMDD